MGSGHFAAVASDSHASQKFVDTAKELVDKYDLDGLDSMIASAHGPLKSILQPGWWLTM